MYYFQMRWNWNRPRPHHIVHQTVTLWTDVDLTGLVCRGWCGSGWRMWADSLSHMFSFHCLSFCISLFLIMVFHLFSVPLDCSEYIHTSKFYSLVHFIPSQLSIRAEDLAVICTLPGQKGHNYRAIVVAKLFVTLYWDLCLQLMCKW